MKLSLILVPFLAILISCDKEDINHDYSPQINFEISDRLFSDRSISSIDFDSVGNAWVGSGNELIFLTKTKTQFYDVSSRINDISVGADGKVWVGTKDKGLACFENNNFTFYTMENAGLPRDYIVDVEASPDGSVWFGSSAHQLGGLMHFDGQKFDLYTPENSLLNQNVILGLKVDKNCDVYCFSEGTVTSTKVFKIDYKNNWYKLGGDIVFYWIASLDINSKSEAVITTDHSLSSCGGCYENEVVIYRKGKWEIIENEFEIRFFNRMFVDKRDYMWVQGSIQDGYDGYFVFDGKNWHHPEANELGDAFVYSAKADPDNNLWFCTNQGIFIINQ